MAAIVFDSEVSHVSCRINARLEIILFMVIQCRAREDALVTIGTAMGGRHVVYTTILFA